MPSARRCSRCRRALGALAAAAPAILAGPARAGETADDLVASLINGCWSCDTVSKVVEVGLKLAEQAFTALAGEMATLLGLLMAVWILFFAGRMFLPFGPGFRVGSLWNDGARKLMHFAVVLAFLQGSQPFWDYVFIPVVGTGISVASRIVELGSAFDTGDAATDPVAGSDKYCTSVGGASGSGVTAATNIMAQMNCPLSRIQNQFAKGIAIGTAVLLGAGQPTKEMLAGPSFLPTPSELLDSLTELVRVADRLICGLVLIAVYFFGFLVFPFLLIDVVMRLTVTAVISPVAIAAWLFKPTRRIAEKATWNLAQSGLTLVFASVAVAVARVALAYTFSNLPTANGQPLTNWKAVITAIQHPNSGGVYISLLSSSFYALLGVGVILLFMLRQASHLAGEFIGASGGDSTGAAHGATATMAGVADAAGKTALKAGGLAKRVAGSLSND